MAHKGEPTERTAGNRDSVSSTVGHRRAPRSFHVLLVLCVLLVVVVLGGCSGGGQSTSTSTAGSPLSTDTSSMQPATTESAPGGATTGMTRASDPARVDARGLTGGGSTAGNRGAGAVDITVEVQPSTSQKVGVTVSESEVGDTGPRWRAACWSAAIVSSSMLNLRLSDYRISYQVAGPADDTGSGALLTVATLAAFLGDPLLTDVAVCAGVNPDGGTSPVTGLLQTLQFAPQAGKRVVVVASGQGTDADAQSGQKVDLLAKARDLYISAAEAPTVGQAYRSITGRELPTLDGVAGPLDFSDEGRQKLKQVVTTWTGYATDFLSKYRALSSRERSDYTDQKAVSAERWIESAKTYVIQGEIGAACGAARKAEYDASLAWLFAVVRSLVSSQGPGAVAASLEKGTPLSDVGTLRATLTTTAPKTVGGVGCLATAWGELVLAESLITQAEDALAAIPAGTSDELAINTAVFAYADAIRCLHGVSEDIELVSVTAGPEVRDAGQMAQVSDAYLRAARANIELVDAMVIPSFAAAMQLSTEQAMARLAVFNGYYGQAKGTIARADALMTELPAGSARDYAVLGAALRSYAGSAVCVAENVSYLAQYDAGGTITGFTYADPLASTLAGADERLDVAIAAADRTGEATLLPVLWREWGIADREGGPGEKMNALYDFWMATILARTMQLLAGDLQPLLHTRG